MNVREAFLHHPEEHTQNTEVQLQYQVNSKWSLSGVGNQNGSFGLDARVSQGVLTRAAPYYS